MRILIIDDDEVFRNTLNRSLQRRGYEVLSSPGHEALKNCQRFYPHAALLDLNMPDENGLSLIPQMKAISPTTRVVVLTGCGSIANALEAVRLGAADYLTKPADTDQIQKALDGNAEVLIRRVPTLDQVEWDHLQRVLSYCGRNISRAAELLGIDRRTLQRKLQREVQPI